MYFGLIVPAYSKSKSSHDFLYYEQALTHCHRLRLLRSYNHQVLWLRLYDPSPKQNILPLT
jgi:hypothetical protein